MNTNKIYLFIFYLGLPFSEAIDVWSLGCLLAELFLGVPLYPALNEYDLIRQITINRGNLPNTMLKVAFYTAEFFRKDPKSNYYFWKLKEPDQYHLEFGKFSVLLAS